LRISGQEQPVCALDERAAAVAGAAAEQLPDPIPAVVGGGHSPLIRRRRAAREEANLAEPPREGSILSLQGVTAKYGATIALREVSLDVMPGELVTVLGANGAGKTTCLGTVMGLVPPAE